MSERITVRRAISAAEAWGACQSALARLERYKRIDDLVAALRHTDRQWLCTELSMAVRDLTGEHAVDWTWCCCDGLEARHLAALRDMARHTLAAERRKRADTGSNAP